MNGGMLPHPGISIINKAQTVTYLNSIAQFWIMLLKRGRRGISPLIATVLLIAFAVSVGVMIINIKPPQSTGSDCDAVHMELQNINGKPMLCYDTLNKKINIMVQNTGEVNIEKLKLIITAEDFSNDQVEIDSSSIKAGDILTKSIDYVRSGTFKIQLAPMINSGGQLKTCLNKSIVAETTISCN